MRPPRFVLRNRGLRLAPFFPPKFLRVWNFLREICGNAGTCSFFIMAATEPHVVAVEPKKRKPMTQIATKQPRFRSAPGTALPRNRALENSRRKAAKLAAALLTVAARPATPQLVPPPLLKEPLISVPPTIFSEMDATFNFDLLPSAHTQTSVTVHVVCNDVVAHFLVCPNTLMQTVINATPAVCSHASQHLRSRYTALWSDSQPHIFVDAARTLQLLIAGQTCR